MTRIDEQGQRLADQAFRTLISLCPEIRTASPANQEAVCAALQAKVAPSIDRLLEDARLAPCLAEAAFPYAVLSLALAGVGVNRFEGIINKSKFSENFSH